MWPELRASLHPPQPIILRYRCHGGRWKDLYRSDVVLQVHLKLLFFDSALIRHCTGICFFLFLFLLCYFLLFLVVLPLGVREATLRWEIGGIYKKLLENCVRSFEKRYQYCMFSIQFAASHLFSCIGG
ncbi:hypothetical protein L873DRAFT_619676 [Choiromyces venosus 120613-1]|uniref:Uncharacterized protein n=1 Tax=Choiromyces venosus 120613-1 TaxID=1336337 RepID=A0A3N4IUK6_9PEZI|nr:hypothetical protein L873DRAFT_619676 [Choiromyces venosus 120613-1]